MKPIYTLALFVLLFASCATPFQVYQTTSEQVKQYEEDVYAFENEDLAIAYDFWSFGGVPLFCITNKTDRSIYIDYTSVFLNVNGKKEGEIDPEIEAHPMHFTIEETQLPKHIIVLPARSSETIEGTEVTIDWHKLKKVKSKQYTRDNSPFQFENKINYSFDVESLEWKSFQNAFWISSIENLKRKEFKAIETTPIHTKSDKFFIIKEESYFGWQFWIDMSMEVLNIASYTL